LEDRIHLDNRAIDLRSHKAYRPAMRITHLTAKEVVVLKWSRQECARRLRNLPRG
jgi:hypothetical protein